MKLLKIKTHSRTHTILLVFFPLDDTTLISSAFSVTPDMTPSLRSVLTVFTFACGLAACTPTPVKKDVNGEGFDSNQMIQSDANRIANLAMRDNLASLSTLLEKLYKRNPAQWKKTGLSPEAARFTVMEAIRTQQPLPGLDDKKSIDAMSLAFDPYFHGDRAGALVYGMGTMLMEVWGGRTEHYMIHGLDAQQLSNAAYNIEMASWMLGTRIDEKGQPYLLSNEISPTARNLSFEREFSKIIGRLELLAAATDEKYRRAGINYVQGLVGAPLLQFLPIGAVTSAATSAAH